MFRSPAVWLSLILLVASGSARAADESVRPELALTLMLKLLTYEARFASLPSGDFVVLLVHSPEQSAALEAARTSLRSLTQVLVQGRPIKLQAASTQSLEDVTAKARAGALLVLAGAPREQLELVGRLARERRIYSLSLDPALIGGPNLLMGVGQGNGKPLPVLSTSATQALEVSFPQSVLRLVRTVR
jgi:hypothetical protein